MISFDFVELKSCQPIILQSEFTMTHRTVGLIFLFFSSCLFFSCKLLTGENKSTAKEGVNATTCEREDKSDLPPPDERCVSVNCHITSLQNQDVDVNIFNSL